MRKFDYENRPITEVEDFSYEDSSKDEKVIFQALRRSLDLSDYKCVDDSARRGWIVETLKLLHQAGYDVTTPKLEPIAWLIMKSLPSAWNMSNRHVRINLQQLRGYAERVQRGGRFNFKTKDHFFSDHIEQLERTI